VDPHCAVRQRRTHGHHPLSRTHVERVAVPLALEELGIAYESIELDPKKDDQHKQPEFLKLNPMGQVPTLLDDGHPMFESSAIINYLGDTYGVERDLYPASGTPERMNALT
jgi:glutathione S-transferase